MKCVVGLGNIGKEYENTRHNLGFMALDYMCKKLNVSLDKKKNKYIFGEITRNGEKIVFAKPTTFMNLSGEAIVEIMNWYKITPKDIVVIYDDVDIKLKDVRYRLRGSSGTHNGMRNIIQNIGTEEFARIRIGMENRNNLPIPLTYYVLQKFSKEELKIIDDEIMPIVEENIFKFLDNKLS